MLTLTPHPAPLDEAARLQALRPYQLLNTMHDETFAELVRLIAKLFNVPVCIVALVEGDTARFGLNHGLPEDLDVVPRGQTLCSVALRQEGVTVFDNLQEQPCELIDMRLVRRLQLGFYAGHTLRTNEGLPIGVLCVIDHQPRALNPAEATLLERLADVVMRLLDLRVSQQLHPDWNKELWAEVYRRIETSVTRLETLSALADWENGDSSYTQSYEASTYEEMQHVIGILREQIQATRPR